MSEEPRYTFSTSHNTSAANAKSGRTHRTRGPKLYTQNPGPQDRLTAAAGPSRPRVSNARIDWEPTLRDPNTAKVWQEAKHKSIRPRQEEIQTYEPDQSRASSGTAAGGMRSVATNINFSGVLDDLDGDTRVDMFGVPVSDSYEADVLPSIRTSEGKVRGSA